LFGTPSYVVEKLIELREVSHVENVVICSGWGAIDKELTMKSLRLFSDRVLPKLA
jgi:hypothetical protein